LNYFFLAATLLKAIQQLVNLFLIGGYAFKGEVRVDPSLLASNSDNASGSKYVISLTSPVILWGARVLEFEREPLTNDFLLKTVTELIRRSGYKTKDVQTKFEGNSEEITITIV
jgi:hypothetical protein